MDRIWRKKALAAGIIGAASVTAIPVVIGAGEESPADVPAFVLSIKGLPQSNVTSGRLLWRSTPALANINHDGAQDLAVHSRNGDGPRVWLGDGKGNWTDTSKGLDIDTSCGGGVSWGDVNNDGHADLAVADACDGVFVLLGDGQGHWNISTRTLNPERSTEVDLIEEGENRFIGALDLAFGDVNEDGFLDLVVASSYEGGFAVYLGDGSGSAWNETRSHGLSSYENPEPRDTENGGWANRVLLHDINGDKHLDVIASFYRGVRAWLGDGKGQWQPYSNGLPTPLIGGIFHGLAVGNINEDGRVDIAVANGVNGPEVFLQGEDGSWQATPDPMPTLRGGAQTLALGNLNQDSHLDLAVGGRRANRGTGYGLFILYGDGKGNWRELQQTSLPGTGLPVIWGITLEDVNGDNLADLAVSTGGPVNGTAVQPDEGPLPPLMQVWLNAKRSTVDQGTGQNSKSMVGKSPDQAVGSRDQVSVDK